MEKIKPSIGVKKMDDIMREQILNEIQPEKVGQSFAYFVLSKIDLDDLYGYMNEYRNHFSDMIKNKLIDKYPTDTDDENMNNFNKDNIKREVDTTASRSMLDLEKWMVNLNLTKDDWSEVFSEIEK